MKNYLVEYFYKSEVSALGRKYLHATEKQINMLWKEREGTYKLLIDGKKRKCKVRLGVCDNSCILATLFYLAMFDLDRIKTGLVCIDAKLASKKKYSCKNIRDMAFYEKVEETCWEQFFKVFVRSIFVFLIIAIVYSLR